ncbi:uncharacterized protein SCHCODRAFT_02496821 [Schizophyllum commune H4-8]|uniref:uncharacterized protein n=1 Tax=Schizophyllum commune (strain H4-8 / FGSC 9210) TaxID=578458 RepID=UPI002160716B|nr:uncharacterized protein SCHCODRAFT_02496821 [Schizophyllum commune H4-8]KAI5895569.1 hypothetical protein SCHCODRAFT_02496821 [Schizophyllum commune H4-8]
MVQQPHLQQASNVTRATQKLDKVAAALPPSETLDRLFTAITDFRSSIEPAFKLIEDQKQDIDTLKTAAERRLSALKSVNENLEKEKKETAKANRRLADTTKKLDAALDCADRSRKWAEDLEAEKREAQRNCDEALRALAARTEAHDKLATDNKRYTGMLENQKKTIERYKREKADLKKEIASLRRERDEARSEMDSMTIDESDPRSDFTFIDDFSELSAPSPSHARTSASTSGRAPIPSSTITRIASTSHHTSTSSSTAHTTLTRIPHRPSSPSSPSMSNYNSPSNSMSISLTAAPSSPPPYTPIEDDFDDCAPFRSDWSTSGMKAGSLARNLSGGLTLGIKRKLAQREEAERPPFAKVPTLRVDRNGRPLGPMACGPKRTRRAPPA